MMNGYESYNEKQGYNGGGYNGGGYDNGGYNGSQNNGNNSGYTQNNYEQKQQNNSDDDAFGPKSGSSIVSAFDAFRESSASYLIV